MITLPTLPTSVSTETGIEPSAADDSQLTSADAPQGFLALLGSRLLSLSQPSGGEAPAARLKGDDNGSPLAELNALLASLDKPESLNALLRPEKAKGETQSADDKDTLKTAELSDSDKQTLQALFAMLPAATAQPVQAEVKNSYLSGADKGDRQNAPFSLPGTLLAKTADGDETGDKAASSRLTPGINGTVNHAKAEAGSPSLSAGTSFQQALNSTAKDDASAQPLTGNDTVLITPVISATSAPVVHSASSTTAAPVTPQLNSQLGSPEWQQALSQQILMFNRNGQQNAELRLHPQDLGTIQISLKLDNDQAQLNMVSGHSQVRAALEAAMPQLRHALAESGINLGQSSVSSEAFPQSQTFSEQQQSRRDGNNGSFAQAMDGDNDITPIEVPATLQARAAGSSGVDIFA